MSWISKEEPSSWLRYVLVPLLVGVLGLLPWIGNWLFTSKSDANPKVPPSLASVPPVTPTERPLPNKEYAIEWALTPLGHRFQTMDVRFEDFVTRKNKQRPPESRDFLCNAGWHLNPQVSLSYDVYEYLCEPRKGKEKICRSHWSHRRREDNTGIHLEYTLPDSDGDLGIRGTLHCVQPMDAQGPKRNGTLRIKAGQIKTLEYGETSATLVEAGLVQGADRGYKAEFLLDGNSLILTDAANRGTLGPVVLVLEHGGIVKAQIP